MIVSGNLLSTGVELSDMDFLSDTGVGNAGLINGVVDSWSIRNLIASWSLEDIRWMLSTTTGTDTVGWSSWDIIIDDIRTGDVVSSWDSALRLWWMSVTERNLLITQWIPILSGTESYFEQVESFDRIGVVPRMVFVLPKDKIYFGLLSTWEYNRTRIARSLQWNALAFITEKDILKNNLPWESVTFINIPQYKEKLVIMIVNINNNKRIIELPRKYYHQSKDKLKNILWSAE